jgi:RND family efflux transporter MFP subunit
MQQKKKFKLSLLIKIILPVVFLALGVWGKSYLQETKPQVSKKPPERVLPVVSVQSADLSDEQAVVQAMGTVVPAREIVLKAQVSGTVQEIARDFSPGRVLSKGDLLLKIDPRDYEIAVLKAESAVAQAKAEIELEEGRQEVARQEVQSLQKSFSGQVSKTDLALRKPQLKKVRAELSAAQAELEKAKLDLSRTVLRTPFNALVRTKEVNLGSQVGVQDTLAQLVGTDEYWVEAAVPLDRLDELALEENKGRQVQIFSQSGNGQWSGKVLRLTGTLNENTRLAKVLISVQDPLGLKSGNKRSTPLMLDDYVSLQIEGRKYRDVISLPREYLREGQTVWVADKGKLDIRKVDIVWKNEQRVFIRSGLQKGEKVLTSDLSTPVQGMQIKVAENENTS